MAHIRLTSQIPGAPGPPGEPDHVHIEEDLSSEADGYKLIFNTTEEYIPGSLVAIYAGVVYTKNNDFTETGPKEITFVNDEPFPPEADCPLVLRYRKEPD